MIRVVNLHIEGFIKYNFLDCQSLNFVSTCRRSLFHNFSSKVIKLDLKLIPLWWFWLNFSSTEERPSVEQHIRTKSLLKVVNCIVDSAKNWTVELLVVEYVVDEWIADELCRTLHHDEVRVWELEKSLFREHTFVVLELFAYCFREIRVPHVVSVDVVEENDLFVWQHRHEVQITLSVQRRHLFKSFEMNRVWFGRRLGHDFDVCLVVLRIKSISDCIVSWEQQVVNCLRILINNVRCLLRPIFSKFVLIQIESIISIFA